MKSIFYPWGRLWFTTKKGMVFCLFLFFLMSPLPQFGWILIRQPLSNLFIYQKSVNLKLSIWIPDSASWQIFTIKSDIFVIECSYPQGMDVKYWTNISCLPTKLCQLAVTEITKVSFHTTRNFLKLIMLNYYKAELRNIIYFYQTMHFAVFLVANLL